MRSRRRIDAELAILLLASGQHGVVTRRQLMSAGVSADAVDRRLKKGRLRVAHPGVYLVAGPVRSPRVREMAAVLACGARAALSHRSAAELWQLLPDLKDSVPVEVTTAEGDHRRPGIRVHHVRTVKANEVTALDGIRITTPARTLYDLASAVEERALERALATAFDRCMTNRAELRSLLRRHSGRPGTSRLRALIERETEPALTRSEAEERLLLLIRRAELPLPASNVRVGGCEVDFFWRMQRLVVEVDGYAFHSSPGTFERDRRRDAVLAAAGVRVVRVTWRQLVSEAEAVLVRLGQALAVSSP
ncbi:MAG: type IV toxin-antitoxin system AbiEi family antitoxin domain-containing protein [Longimicrobiales bacterium]